MNWVRFCEPCSWTWPTSHDTAVLGVQARYFVLIKLFAEALRDKHNLYSPLKILTGAGLH